MAITTLDSHRAIEPQTHNKLALISFKMMRKWVGILGLSIGALLPLVTYLLTNCNSVQESISHYYYTIAGDVFVGLLCAVGFFLIMYPGNGKWEDLWTNAAGMLAVAIAFFPTSYKQLGAACTEESYVYAPWVSTVHFASAAIFFLILGYVAFRQFPSSSAGAFRNNIYRGCAIVMWLCLLILSPMIWNEEYSDLLSRNKVVFILEVVALLAFGSSWLIKGFELESMHKETAKPSTVTIQ